MAIATMTIDPAGTSYTDDEIVGKVNAAADNITRAGSVEATARPIEALEVDTAELAAGAVSDAKMADTAAKDNLDALADTARGYVKTSPIAGEFPVIAIHRNAAELLDVEYDDVAIV